MDWNLLFCCYAELTSREHRDIYAWKLDPFFGNKPDNEYLGLWVETELLGKWLKMTNNERVDEYVRLAKLFGVESDEQLDILAAVPW